MIYLLVLLNCFLTYLVLYCYYRYKSYDLDKFTIIRVLLGSNLVLIITLYLFSSLFPNNTFRDLFNADHYNELLGTNHRYINEIGESVFSSEPPF